MTHAKPEGFLALPTADSGRGILVLHPWWGLNDTITTFCTRLSQQGYAAFAPDLYHGKLATTIPEAERLSQALDADRARADIAAAVNYLNGIAAQPDQGLAVIGFSLGAFFALELSTVEPERIRTVVVFYGTGPGDYTASKAAYLGHFAAADEYEPESEVNRLEASLIAAGRPVSFYRYPGTGHWFFEPDRTAAYKPDAAVLAWQRTLEFLKIAMENIVQM